MTSSHGQGKGKIEELGQHICVPISAYSILVYSHTPRDYLGSLSHISRLECVLDMISHMTILGLLQFHSSARSIYSTRMSTTIMKLWRKISKVTLVEIRVVLNPSNKITSQQHFPSNHITSGLSISCFSYILKVKTGSCTCISI